MTDTKPESSPDSDGIKSRPPEQRKARKNHERVEEAPVLDDDDDAILDEIWDSL